MPQCCVVLPRQIGVQQGQGRFHVAHGPVGGAPGQLEVVRQDLEAG